MATIIIISIVAAIIAAAWFVVGGISAYKLVNMTCGVMTAGQRILSLITGTLLGGFTAHWAKMVAAQQAAITNGSFAEDILGNLNEDQISEAINKFASEFGLDLEDEA